MLNGIDYYPKKKKRKKLIIFLLFLFVALAYSVWTYIISQRPSEVHSTLIVISVPESEEETDEVIVESVQNTPAEAESGNSENLDEVIQTYEASSYN